MGKSKKQFKSEVQQLLNLVIHSLYSNTDIFMRELIANASDAIDRLRFESLTQKELIKGAPEGKIKISADKEGKTLTFSDNGIGMTRKEVEKNIGTIARSGTRAFLEELKKSEMSNTPDMIGQFGVGFYSSFMVADKVTLVTRKAGDDAGCKWVSTGNGSYTIEDCEKDTQGTEITLHLKDEKENYLEEWQIRKIVKQFSDFVEYPITMDIAREEPAKDKDGKELKGAPSVTVVEERTLNSMKAIWMRPKSEIKDEEYNEFYRHISHDYTDPSKVIHFNAEGALEFKALLYIPAKAPFDLFFRDNERKGIHLYVKRVYITDDCQDLMPEYLRFVKGVVESNDLPLNVSREILQENATVKKIQKSLVAKVLSTLKDMKGKKPDDYNSFYLEFGRVLKEGIHFDFGNRDKLQELVMYESTKSDKGKFITLNDYINRMNSEQKEIFYLAGENREALENSPHLEIFKRNDIEVLFMVDPIDEWVVQGMTEYKEKKLRAIDRGDVDLDFTKEKKETEEEKVRVEKKYKDLLDYIKEKLKDRVKEVKFSSRLTASASCLVNDEFGMSAHMERIFKSMNQESPPSQRILELNSKHPIMRILLSLFNTDKNNKKLEDYVELLYDQAALAEGTPIKNPLRLTSLISDLMVAEGNGIIKNGTRKARGNATGKK